MNAPAKTLLVLPVLALLALSCGGGGGGGGGGDADPVFRIVETRPVNGEKFVSQDIIPRVVFSKGLDTSTLGGAVALHDGTETVAGVLLLGGDDRTLMFDPTDRLDISKTYTLTLAATIGTSTGETLGEARAIAFSTVTQPTPRPPEARDFHPTWTRLSVGRSQHTATLLEDGTVLLAGGFTGPMATTSTVEIYDPETFSFTLGSTQLTNARARHTATRLADGRVLIVGGMATGGTTALATCEIYNPVQASFGTTGELHHARGYHTAELLDDGRVVVIGGAYYDSQGDWTQLAVAEIYDPATGNWSEIADMMVRDRSFHTSTRLEDGRILVAGGASDQAAEFFDPATLTFTRTAGNMKDWRGGHTAFLLDNGLVLMSGGGAARGELYDPDRNTFDRSTNGLSFDSYYATATPTRDGGILILGGIFFGDVTVILASMDLYSQVQSPLGSYFQVIHTLEDPRAGHTATVLDDGSTLIAGGINPDPLESEFDTALIFRQDD